MGSENCQGFMMRSNEVDDLSPFLKIGLNPINFDEVL